ncbi:MAG: YdcF family protein [Clostridiales bacterium]|nr:YdcF family protein [Clostridiales bacterium]
MKHTKQSKRKGLKLMLWLVGIALAAYAALVAWVYIQEISVPAPAGYDSIIVLGAQVKPDGEPSVQLRWRLDRAREVYDASPCYIVVTGGQGKNEPAPEGDVMRSLLIAEGVPQEHVFSDPVSVNTRQNLDNAWAILSELGCKRPVVVTSDYHLPRAMAMVRDMGLEPQGAGSLCRPGIFFWLKNHLREALAWGKYWCVKYLGLPL